MREQLQLLLRGPLIPSLSPRAPFFPIPFSTPFSQLLLLAFLGDSRAAPSLPQESCQSLQLRAVILIFKWSCFSPSKAKCLMKGSGSLSRGNSVVLRISGAQSRSWDPFRRNSLLGYTIASVSSRSRTTVTHFQGFRNCDRSQRYLHMARQVTSESFRFLLLLLTCWRLHARISLYH